MAKKNSPTKSAGESTKKASGTKARRRIPTHEEISQKAHEIYLERISKGEPGSTESDWQQALDILQA